MAQTLLVELLTEELPPKALSALGRAFANGIRDELDTLGLAPKTRKYEQDLARPRRHRGERGDRPVGERTAGGGRRIREEARRRGGSASAKAGRERRRMGCP